MASKLNYKIKIMGFVGDKRKDLNKFKTILFEFLIGMKFKQ